MANIVKKNNRGRKASRRKHTGKRRSRNPGRLSVSNAKSMLTHAVPIAAGYIGAAYVGPMVQDHLPAWAQGTFGTAAVGVATAAGFYFIPKYGKPLAAGALVLTAYRILKPIFSQAEGMIQAKLMPAPVPVAAPMPAALPAPAAKVAGLGNSQYDYWEGSDGAPYALSGFSEYDTAMGYE